MTNSILQRCPHQYVHPVPHSSCNVIDILSLPKIHSLCSFLLNLSKLMPASNRGVEQKWCSTTSKVRKKKKYNSAWFLLSVSVSLGTKPPSYKEPQAKWRSCVWVFLKTATAKPLANTRNQPPEMWEIVIHIITVPNIQVFPAEGHRRHEAETYIVRLNSWTTETMRDQKKKIIVFKIIKFWGNLSRIFYRAIDY